MKVYLEALGDLGEANPAFANAIKMLKTGIQAQALAQHQKSLANQESKENLSEMQNEKSKEDPKKTENLTEEEAK